MYSELSLTLTHVWQRTVPEERKGILQALISFIREKAGSRQAVNLNFICTHNSRRSHLAQVWAQVAASYFRIPEVYAYSGGTEETALFPKVAETLQDQGFKVFRIAEGTNPVYALKYSDHAPPVIGFSKKYDHPFNPASAFAAVMTCSQADSGCPFIAGAEKRIALTFEDPKASDNTPLQATVYAERSLQIGAEMFYVFSMVSG